MADRVDDLRPATPGLDSHAGVPEPSGQGEFPAAPSKPQKSLDVSAAIPLHLKIVLTYAEAAALGLAPERTLRRLVAMGRVRRSVLRTGRRVRFVRDVLIDELRGAEG